jgi:hypothetical protein
VEVAVPVGNRWAAATEEERDIAAAFAAERVDHPGQQPTGLQGSQHGGME